MKLQFGVKGSGITDIATLVKSWEKVAKGETRIIKPIFEPVKTKEDFSDPDLPIVLQPQKEEVPTCKNAEELVALVTNVKMKRKVTRIIYHCTATQPEATVTSIMRYWKENIK